MFNTHGGVYNLGDAGGFCDVGELRMAPDSLVCRCKVLRPVPSTEQIFGK